MTYRTEDEQQLLMAYLAWRDRQPEEIASLSHEDVVAMFLAWRQDAREWGKG